MFYPRGTTNLSPSAGKQQQEQAINEDRSARVGDQPFIGARPVDLTGDTSFSAPNWPRAIYVGTGGTLKIDVLDIDGATTLTAKTVTVYDGQTLPWWCVTKIYSTSNGTTASGLWVGV